MPALFEIASNYHFLKIFLLTTSVVNFCFKLMLLRLTKLFLILYQLPRVFIVSDNRYINSISCI